MGQRTLAFKISITYFVCLYTIATAAAAAAAAAAALCLFTVGRLVLCKCIKPLVVGGEGSKFVNFQFCS